MLARTLTAFVVVTVSGSGLSAQENDAPAKVGDHLVVRMTGDLATEYARRTGSLRESEPPAGLTIEIIATVAQQMDDRRIRLEHSSSIKRDGKQTRLVTLTATVDPNDITTHIVPKGTAVHSSPLDNRNGKKVLLTNDDTKTLRLRLGELKGLRLRTWTLVDEIGD